MGEVEQGTSEAGQPAFQRPSDVVVRLLPQESIGAEGPRDRGSLDDISGSRRGSKGADGARLLVLQRGVRSRAASAVLQAWPDRWLERPLRPDNSNELHPLGCR